MKGGQLATGSASLQVAENEAAPMEVDDRCEYHLGALQKVWRCENPRLEGFKVCVTHRCACGSLMRRLVVE